MQALLVLHDAQGAPAAREAALRDALALAQAWRDETQGGVEVWADAADLASMPGTSVHALPQGESGARIWLALCLSLAKGDAPLLVRSSGAGVTLAHLRQARALLAQADAVFGVDRDGAYAVVGLRRAVPELFARLPEDAGKMMAATRARAARRGCRISEFLLVAA